MLAEADVNPTNAEQVTPTVNSVQAAFSACIRIQDPWYNTRWNASKAGTFPSSTAGRLGVHHAGGMNTIWADGHAKWTKNPPEDCHSYISGMPAGAKSIRTAPATDVCRPAGSDVGFCYTQ